MVTLSRKELEHISRKILADYLRLCDTPPTRIDPHDLGAKLYGVKFQYCDLGNYKQALGITSRSNCELRIWNNTGDFDVVALDGRTALIDSSLLVEGQEGRLHFTMMHEVSHKIIEDMYPDNLPIRYCEDPLLYRLSSVPHTGEIIDWGEWQANTLTSYLLLPRELIFKHMKRVGLDGGIRCLNRKFSLKEYAKFSDVAASLGVSKTALAIRLNQMGLVQVNNFSNPYDLVNVYPDKDEIF